MSERERDREEKKKKVGKTTLMLCSVCSAVFLVISTVHKSSKEIHTFGIGCACVSCSLKRGEKKLIHKKVYISVESLLMKKKLK